MTTQEFFQSLEASAFSEQTKHYIKAAIGDADEFTPEIKETVLFLMENDIEADLADVSIDTAEAAQIEQELETELDRIEQSATEDVATVEREVNELIDMSKKVDVLERLHS